MTTFPAPHDAAETTPRATASKGTPWARPAAITPRPARATANSGDLAQTRTLAERNDSKRNREQRLKRRYHGGEPRRQTDAHRHKEQAELPHADEQPNGNDHRPAHIRLGHEEDRQERRSAQSVGPAKRSGAERSRPMSMTTKFTAFQTATTSARTSVPARHQCDPVTTSVMRPQASGRQTRLRGSRPGGGQGCDRRRGESALRLLRRRGLRPTRRCRVTWVASSAPPIAGPSARSPLTTFTRGHARLRFFRRLRCRLDRL